MEVRTIIKKGREDAVWYAIRVTYNRELKVKDDLDARGIECFVPMQYRREERNGVMVKRLVPSVHNLIFIKLKPSEMTEYKRSTELPIRYIMNRETHKPITVPNREMENFIRVAGTYEEKLIYLTPDPGDFSKGERVRIIGGPFQGAEGIFVDVFPYINMNKDARKGERHLRRTQLWCKAGYLFFIKHPTVLERMKHQRIAALGWTLARGVVRLCMSPKRLRAGFARACAVTEPGEYWGNPCAVRPYPYHKDVLFPVREMEFDGLTVYAPNDCDAYLTELYGDYMSIPAPEKRHKHTPTVLDFGDGVNVMSPTEA